MPTVALKTLGCKLNQYETEALRAALEGAGFVATPFAASADYYVINTCTVTGRADYKSRQLIRRVCRERPAARVIVTGCYAERAGGAVAALGPNVTVVPNGAKENIPALLGAPASSPRRVTTFAAKTRLFLKVQDGCGHRCSYCAVAPARGPSRSRPAAEVLADVRAAVAAGVKEVVLVGVDLGSYGRDLGRGRSLARLCASLASLGGDFRLRLSSVDVADFGPELAAELANGGRLCPHVHLPLQSGDDRVLAAMRRRYRARDYRRLCDELLAQVPAVAIGADVIAGLPGEDDAAFARTCALLEELPLAYVHVFPFSARPGTAAAAAAGQVPPATRERRARVLREIAAAKKRAFGRRSDGDVRPALVEGRGRRRRDVIALTDNYLRLRLDGYDGPGNRFANVRVKVDGDALAGTVVS